MQVIKKIVILGPECTGKSTLCKQLAEYYQTIWCKEFARAYLLNNGNEYAYADLEKIAEGQLNLEDRCMDELQRNILANKSISWPFLFIDTDMYVMKIWCEYVFENCHPFILDQIALRKYDLYLLCNIDLPWEQDGLREYPEAAKRQELFNMYHDLLVHQSTPWAIISGSINERLQQAIAVIRY
jgi:NadR type nicotinamide-nucleotide adenylyltransferase